MDTTTNSKNIWLEIIRFTFTFTKQSVFNREIVENMYYDLWPYVLWPLDFQIQKRIVSAETTWGNTVIREFVLGE